MDCMSGCKGIQLKTCIRYKCMSGEDGLLTCMYSKSGGDGVKDKYFMPGGD